MKHGKLCRLFTVHIKLRSSVYNQLRLIRYSRALTGNNCALFVWVRSSLPSACQKTEVSILIECIAKKKKKKIPGNLFIPDNRII
jgi:hypothetical protein